MKAYIITHTDADGVGAAALYLKALRKRYGENLEYYILFTEPYKIYDTLRNSIPINDEPRIICILDIGGNPGLIDRVAGYLRRLGGNTITEWIDHHVWENNWVEKLKRTGTKMFIDTSTCATGLVYDLYKDILEDIDSYLASTICSADLWKWDEWLSPYIYRVVGRYRGGMGDEWRRHLVEEFSRGRIWNDALQEMVEEYIDRELEGYVRALSRIIFIEHDSLRLSFTVKKPGPPNNSLLASYIISRYDADIAVIVRTDASLSLRSRSHDVRKIASCIGGGGHPRASGASLKIPFYYRLLRLLAGGLYEDLLIRKAIRKVVGCLQGLNGD